MSNKQHESSKAMTALIIGGVIGATVLYKLASSRRRPPTLMQKIGETVSELGKSLENCEESCSHATQDFKKNLSKSSLQWIAEGMNIWQQFKKRM